mgnify:FL=1
MQALRTGFLTAILGFDGNILDPGGADRLPVPVLSVSRLPRGPSTKVRE